jgi:hypothetical protein
MRMTLGVDSRRRTVLRLILLADPRAPVRYHGKSRAQRIKETWGQDERRPWTGDSEVPKGRWQHLPIFAEPPIRGRPRHPPRPALPMTLTAPRPFPPRTPTELSMATTACPSTTPYRTQGVALTT